MGGIDNSMKMKTMINLQKNVGLKIKKRDIRMNDAERFPLVNKGSFQ